jgi:hypothetical protein
MSLRCAGVKAMSLTSSGVLRSGRHATMIFAMKNVEIAQWVQLEYCWNVEPDWKSRGKLESVSYGSKVIATRYYVLVL